MSDVSQNVIRGDGQYLRLNCKHSKIKYYRRIKMKRAVALLLTAVMSVSVLAGCGSGGSDSSSGAASAADTAQSGSAGEEAAASEDSSSEITTTAYGEYTAENPYQLRFAYVEYYDEDEQARKDVAAAMNEILIPQYHIEVELYPLTWNFGQEESLMISGGDKLDVMTVGGEFAQGQMNMNGLINLRPYLDSAAGQPIKDVLGEKEAYLMSIGDFTYGIPSMAALCEYAFRRGFIMRADICDELGISEKYNLQLNDDGYYGVYYSLDTMEEILRQVHETYPEMIPLYFDKNNEARLTWFDSLNDDFGVLDVAADPDSTTVVNKFETQTYHDFAERMARWYDEGLIYGDSVNMEDGWGNLLAAGNTFSSTQSIKGGCLLDIPSSQYDYYVMHVGVPEANISSSTINFMNAGICSNSDDPDMAWNFIVALYTNPALMETWQYGIKDVHYQILDDGSAYFVDGEDAASYTYHQNSTWQMGDYTTIPVWNNAAGDISYWEKRITLGTWTRYSPAYGFNFDSTEYQTQITALNNVLASYKSALEHGAIGGVDKLDSTLKSLNDALYAAGLQDVIDAKQAQLDAWIEANGGPAQTPQENLDKLAGCTLGE